MSKYLLLKRAPVNATCKVRRERLAPLATGETARWTWRSSPKTDRGFLTPPAARPHAPDVRLRLGQRRARPAAHPARRRRELRLAAGERGGTRHPLMVDGRKGAPAALILLLARTRRPGPPRAAPAACWTMAAAAAAASRSAQLTGRVLAPSRLNRAGNAHVPSRGGRGGRRGGRGHPPQPQGEARRPRQGARASLWGVRVTNTTGDTSQEKPVQRAPTSLWNGCRTAARPSSAPPRPTTSPCSCTCWRRGSTSTARTLCVSGPRCPVDVHTSVCWFPASL